MGGGESGVSKLAGRLYGLVVARAVSQFYADKESVVWHGYTMQVPLLVFDGSADLLLHAGKDGSCALVDGNIGSAVVGGDIW